MVPLVLLLMQLFPQLLKVNLPGRALFHLFDQEVVHASASDILNLVVLARLTAIFGLPQHELFALLHQLFERLGVVLREVGEHVSVPLGVFLFLLHHARVHFLVPRRQRPRFLFAVLVVSLLLNSRVHDDSPLVDVLAVLLHDDVLRDGQLVVYEVLVVDLLLHFLFHFPLPCTLRPQEIDHFVRCVDPLELVAFAVFDLELVVLIGGVLVFATEAARLLLLIQVFRSIMAAVGRFCEGRFAIGVAPDDLNVPEEISVVHVGSFAVC